MSTCPLVNIAPFGVSVIIDSAAFVGQTQRFACGQIGNPLAFEVFNMLRVDFASSDARDGSPICRSSGGYTSGKFDQIIDYMQVGCAAHSLRLRRCVFKESHIL